MLAAAGVAACVLPFVQAEAQEHVHMERAAYQDAWIKTTPADPSEAWTLAYGGRLYDQWAEILDQNLPARTHLSYPKTAQQKGADTWRCVECHGWDYKGASGAFATGEHATGIKGIGGMAGAEPERIVALLRDGTHRYTLEMLPDAAMLRIDNPALGVEEISRTMERVDTGRYVLRGPEFAAPGRWRVKIELLVTDFEKRAAGTSVDIGSGQAHPEGR